MITELINKMIEYETACPQRINHFLKVWAFAKQIAENENIDLKTKFIIESVAVIHDIGIKPSLEKYNSSAGHYQQIEGPTVAGKILSDLGYGTELIDRIGFFVANHHTYDKVDE
jgi:HD superfamily phosphodiesterase